MGLEFLRRWFNRTPERRDDWRIVVYTRAACPLCDEALAVLWRFQDRYGFSIETRDDDDSAEWIREFGEWVPVVVINGDVRFRGHVNEVLLRRLLDAG